MQKDGALRVYNARLLSEDGVLIENAEILVENGQISELHLGPPRSSGERPAEGTVQIDAGGNLVLPGLINTHTHSAMTLLRSYADDLTLMDWLQNKIWPVEAHLEPEDVYWGTMLATVEMLRTGTTCCSDMYLYMDSAAEAFQVSGMRAVVAQGLFSFLPDPAAALTDSVEFCRRWNGAAGGRLSTLLAPHAPYTCEPEYLRQILEAGQSLGVGLHTHLSESKGEVAQSFAEHGVSPVEHLLRLGVIGEHPLLAAHCVHLSEEDIEIIAAHNVAVAHNPQCNMKLGNGIAPIAELLAAGVAVGVATDGVASNNNLNLWEEIQLAALLQKGKHGDPTLLPAAQALSLATVKAAEALGLSGRVGRLEPGYRADMVFIDLDQPQFQPLHDPGAAMVYSAYGSEVSRVFVDGVELVRNGKLTGFDESEIYAKAGECAQRVLAAARG